jgi:phage/plasmid primase-like uncharacterized protein
MVLDITHLQEKIEATLTEFRGREACSDPRSEFINQLVSDGYEAPKQLYLGKIARINAPDDKKKSGWCWYEEFDDNYHDGHVIGYGQYGSWKDESKITWSSRGDEYLTKDQKHEINQAREASKKQREAELEMRYAEAAVECWKIYNKSPDATDHGYLTRKKIDACGLIKLVGNRLAIPMMNDKNELTSLQYIYPDGKKRYHTGGKIKGSYFTITGTTERVYVAEGYATACSIHMATGATVVVSFTVHKLLDAVNYAKSMYPQAEIVIAGDDDRESTVNIGKQKAKEIAQTMGLIARFPDGGGDWNDTHCTQGLEAVTDQLNLVHEAYQVEKGEKNPLPESLQNPPAIIGDIVNYYKLTDKRSNNVLALPSAIALASLIVARNFDTSNENRSSLFVLNVARTGAGKEHCSRVVERILMACDMIEYNAANGYKSGSAVFSKCLDMPRHMAVIPEFSVFLDSMTNKNASSHQAQAKGVLLEVSTKLDGVLTPPAYATKGLKEADKKIFNDHVVNPAVTLLATTTPEVYGMITNEMIVDGFLNRFIICISDEPMNYLRQVEKHEVPESIVSWVKAINKRLGDREEIATEQPKLTTLAFAPQAKEAFNAYEIELTDRINGELSGSVLKNMLVRSNELAMRVALIVALAKNPDAEFIYKEDAEWAVEFIKYNSEQTLKTLRNNLANSPHEKKRMEWLKAIRERGAKGIEYREISRIKPFSAENKRTCNELLVELLESDLITEASRKSGGKGRPIKYYYAI